MRKRVATRLKGEKRCHRARSSAYRLEHGNRNAWDLQSSVHHDQHSEQEFLGCSIDCWKRHTRLQLFKSTSREYNSDSPLPKWESSVSTHRLLAATVPGHIMPCKCWFGHVTRDILGRWDLLSTKNTSFCFQPISAEFPEAPFTSNWDKQQPYVLFETLPVGRTDKDFSSLIQKKNQIIKIILAFDNTVSGY